MKLQIPQPGQIWISNQFTDEIIKNSYVNSINVNDINGKGSGSLIFQSFYRLFLKDKWKRIK